MSDQGNDRISPGGGGGLFNKIDFRGGGLNGRGGYSREGAYLFELCLATSIYLFSRKKSNKNGKTLVIYIYIIILIFVLVYYHV